jgi:GntR family transcriptional regulator/MocR family aminotransferase
MHADWIIDYLQGHLQRQGPSTLSQQVYKLLRDAIARQQLVADTALPATRMLAQALQIGRNTVLAAYDQLLAEGYLYSRPGAGTFVSPAFSSHGQHQATASGHVGLSQRGQALADQYRLPTGLTGAFAQGLPELRQFPHALWQRLQHQHNRQAPSHWWHYQQEGWAARLTPGHLQLFATIPLGALPP